jgi:hypothetical protein
VQRLQPVDVVDVEPPDLVGLPAVNAQRRGSGRCQQHGGVAPATALEDVLLEHWQDGDLDTQLLRDLPARRCVRVLAGVDGPSGHRPGAALVHLRTAEGQQHLRAGVAGCHQEGPGGTRDAPVPMAAGAGGVDDKLLRGSRTADTDDA